MEEENRRNFAGGEVLPVLASGGLELLNVDDLVIRDDPRGKVGVAF